MDEAKKERIKSELMKVGLFSEFDNDIFGDAKGQCKVIVVIYDDRVVFRYQGEFLQTVRTITDKEFDFQCKRLKNVLSKKAES